jgi:hypothetical protein
VLLFDYRHFGASGGEPRQLLDISRQHADFHRALAYVRDLDWVDPERVGLFGSSFAAATSSPSGRPTGGSRRSSRSARSPIPSGQSCVGGYRFVQHGDTPQEGLCALATSFAT